MLASIPSFLEMTDDLETEMYNVVIEMLFWILTTDTGGFKISNMNKYNTERMCLWPPSRFEKYELFLRNCYSLSI